MKTRLYLYGSLIISVAIQTAFVGNVWFPDIMLLIVIFTGVFMGRLEGSGMGVAAGLLRGFFSVNTLAANIVIFPVVGIMSSVLGKRFYRQNPVAQIFITILAVLIMIGVQVLYLNWINQNDVSMLNILSSSWKRLLLTVLLAPVFFIFLKSMLRLEEA